MHPSPHAKSRMSYTDISGTENSENCLKVQYATSSAEQWHSSGRTKWLSKRTPVTKRTKGSGFVRMIHEQSSSYTTDSSMITKTFKETLSQMTAKFYNFFFADFCLLHAESGVSEVIEAGCTILSLVHSHKKPLSWQVRCYRPAKESIITLSQSDRRLSKVIFRRLLAILFCNHFNEPVGFWNVFWRPHSC